ncbi:MAG: L,D-transpeptidase family protein [Rhizobiaceae bacterium]
MSSSLAIAAPPVVPADAPAVSVAAESVAVSKQDADKLKKPKAAAKTAKPDPKAEAARAAAAKKAEEEKRKLAEARKKAEEKAQREALKKAEADKRIAEKKKAEDARKLAAAKAAEARQKAEADRKLAIARAAEEKRLAAQRAAEAARQAEVSRLVSMDIVKTGNNSELRSETKEQPKPVGLFAGLFGSPVVKQSMLPETRALDAAMEQREAKRRFKAKAEFEPQVVSFPGYQRGTIVIDTANHFLYLVEGSNKARRYGIAVGKDGLQYKGNVKVADKQEWPRWIPTKEMQQREPKKYGQYADGMPGGGMNPLGARAIYLYANGKDTHLRIHGTIAPETIGTNSSNGCFRMINEHVIDLYRRVAVGTDVIVL